MPGDRSTAVSQRRDPIFELRVDEKEAKADRKRIHRFYQTEKN